LSLRRAGVEAEESLSSKVSGLRLEKGDILRLETSGGGGHGALADRDAAAIAEDHAEGYVSC
jgi:N-methylhydantoinase B